MTKDTERRTGANENPELTKFLAKVDAFIRISTAIAKWGSIALCFMFSYFAVDSLSGKITIANIDARARMEANFQLPGDEEGQSSEAASGEGEELNLLALPECPAWWLVFGGLLLGGGGIAYGLHQQRIRQDAIERMHDFQKKYELSVDPKRSSSNLTLRGNTRPEDE